MEKLLDCLEAPQNLGIESAFFPFLWGFFPLPANLVPSIPKNALYLVMPVPPSSWDSSNTYFTLFCFFH